MDWNLMYPNNKQPTMNDISNYIGESKDLWILLMSYFDTVYKVKPKLTYSCCGMKPGWNIKYQKNGQSFGTIYPQENAFDVMIIISYKFNSEMEKILPGLSEQTANLYRSAGDYMKLGKWMMLRINDKQVLDDYMKIVAVKSPPKIVV